MPLEVAVDTQASCAIPVHWIVTAIDSALHGSEYGRKAWELIRERIRNYERFDLDNVSELEELLDRAVDDLEGPGLRVDLSRMRLYP